MMYWRRTSSSKRLIVIRVNFNKFQWSTPCVVFLSFIRLILFYPTYKDILSKALHIQCFLLVLFYFTNIYVPLSFTISWNIKCWIRHSYLDILKEGYKQVINLRKRKNKSQPVIYYWLMDMPRKQYLLYQ